jgi:hypothetical protein
MRVGQALAGQGWMLKDTERLVPGWDRLVNEMALDTALEVFKGAKGRPLAEKVATVESVMSKAGLPLSSVMKASKAYWKKLP